MLYLDHNATTPVLPEVADAVLDTMRRHWANPSSPHEAGQAARGCLQEARAKVARFLGCQPTEVVFTSGATEANHIALRGAIGHGGRRGLVLSAAEHAGVHKLAQHLARQDASVRVIGLDAQGSLRLDEADALINEDTALVSVMAANNETGVLMPTAEMARLAHARGALLHVDATQLVGKLPFEFERSGADLVSVSAHKFGGPKGVGALLVRRGLNWTSLFQGSQERGRRGGTENLPAIVGMGVAADVQQWTSANWHQRTVKLAALRDQFEARLRAACPELHVYGQTPSRLPQTSYLRLGMVHADLALKRLSELGVMAASGSACSSGGQAASPVLTAMGVPRDEALCAVRLSLSVDTPEAALMSLAERWPQSLRSALESTTAPRSPTGVPA
jgi:cysteine desulfurase